MYSWKCLNYQPEVKHKIVLKNDFTSNWLAIIPCFTTNLVFMVISSNSISTELLNISYAGWRMLKRASERSLKVKIPGSIS